MVGGTISKVQIDKRLIGYAGGFRLRFEIVYGVNINIDGDLLFQLFGVRIWSGLAEIIFCLHFVHLIHSNIYFHFWLLCEPK